MSTPVSIAENIEDTAPVQEFPAPSPSPTFTPPNDSAPNSIETENHRIPLKKKALVPDWRLFFGRRLNVFSPVDDSPISGPVKYNQFRVYFTQGNVANTPSNSEPQTGSSTNPTIIKPHSLTQSPVIVLIHGATQSSRVFSNLNRVLSKTNFPLLTYDWRAHGHSKIPQTLDLSLDILVDDLFTVLWNCIRPFSLSLGDNSESSICRCVSFSTCTCDVSLRFPPLLLIGHSIGATIAVKAANVSKNNSSSHAKLPIFGVIVLDMVESLGRTFASQITPTSNPHKVTDPLALDSQSLLGLSAELKILVSSRGLFQLSSAANLIQTVQIPPNDIDIQFSEHDLFDTTLVFEPSKVSYRPSAFSSIASCLEWALLRSACAQDRKNALISLGDQLVPIQFVIDAQISLCPIDEFITWAVPTVSIFAQPLPVNLPHFTIFRIRSKPLRDSAAQLLSSNLSLRIRLNAPMFFWRTPFGLFQNCWQSWFVNYNKSLLALDVPKLLLVPATAPDYIYTSSSAASKPARTIAEVQAQGVDRLNEIDPDLLVGHMQGLLQIDVIKDSNHCLHEDQPLITAQKIVGFIQKQQRRLYMMDSQSKAHFVQSYLGKISSTHPSQWDSDKFLADYRLVWQFSPFRSEE